MVWQTLWALVLGFALSGAVQAFVSRRQMQRLLGDHRPLTVARAAGLGMASSSCSYAATAMAKSLFTKGADFLSAMVFMIASTNLVVELGIVIVVLLGWPFLAAELVGGPIMIVLVVLTGAALIPAGVVASVRRRQAPSPSSEPAEADQQGRAASWKARLGSRDRWADAAAYALGDLRMVRRELLVGYVVAGVLATVVPVDVWHAAFVHGSGLWSDVENALIGPVIAFASFVCSIGNVPLAAALWHGGIAFGGVVSFLFADLLAAPLVFIYRRYYGGALTARLVLVLWALMAAGGLIVQALFTWAGIVPAVRPGRLVPLAVHVDATTALDIVAVGALVVLWWLRRTGGTPGSVVVDPVCGMQFDWASAPVTIEVDGSHYAFCSVGCRDRFLRDHQQVSSRS